MKVRLASGSALELSTGRARRLIQAGEAVEVLDNEPTKRVDDDKPKSKPGPKGPAKDRGADASSG